jgi:hypothetical protein
MSDSQTNPPSDAQAARTETKFAVGWQKLTKEEFLEAVALALVEKVQDLPSLQSANPTAVQILPKTKNAKRSQAR